jgi:hypothetical protein
LHELHIADTDLTDRTSVSSTRNHGAIRFSYLVHSQSVRETGVDMLALLGITGIDLGSTFVDALTLGVFMVSAILSIRLRITVSQIEG